MQMHPSIASLQRSTPMHMQQLLTDSYFQHFIDICTYMCECVYIPLHRTHTVCASHVYLS